MPLGIPPPSSLAEYRAFLLRCGRHLLFLQPHSWYTICLPIVLISLGKNHAPFQYVSQHHTILPWVKEAGPTLPQDSNLPRLSQIFPIKSFSSALPFLKGRGSRIVKLALNHLFWKSRSGSGSWFVILSLLCLGALIFLSLHSLRSVVCLPMMTSTTLLTGAGCIFQSWLQPPSCCTGSSARWLWHYSCGGGRSVYFPVSRQSTESMWLLRLGMKVIEFLSGSSGGLSCQVGRPRLHAVRMIRTHGEAMHSYSGWQSQGRCWLIAASTARPVRDFCLQVIPEPIHGVTP